MKTAKTYLQNELDQNVPKKIIGYFRLSHVGLKEKVFAAAGTAGLIGPSNSLVVMQDRIVYVNFSTHLSENPAHTISFLDFKAFETEPKDNNCNLYILLNSGEKLDTGIIAPADEINKLQMKRLLWHKNA